MKFPSLFFLYIYWEKGSKKCRNQNIAPYLGIEVDEKKKIARGSVPFIEEKEEKACMPILFGEMCLKIAKEGIKE